MKSSKMCGCTWWVESRAHTEEDQIEDGAALNRAVLGFAREREAFLAIIQDRLAARRVDHLRPLSGPYATMAEAVFAEVIGLSVLESVLKDRSDLEEVQVVGTRIFEVRRGRSRRSAYRFRSLQDVERLQQNLVLFNQESITARKKWAEVSLPDGARVTMTGFGYTREPTITIRFFPVQAHTLESLMNASYSTLDEQTAQLLRAIVAARLNIVIIGATNSGKSHLLKALIAEMPDEQRIVTIEQRCELFIGKLFPDKNVENSKHLAMMIVATMVNKHFALLLGSRRSASFWRKFATKKRICMFVPARAGIWEV